MKTEEIKKIMKNKRVQWAFSIIVLFSVIILGSTIRLSNWDLLTDQTTGEKIPLALDPFYFLRLSETILEEGGLPELDLMRYPSSPSGFNKEILPYVIVGMYKIGNVFGDYTLAEVNVFSPVIFYFVSVVLFFFLVYALTRSKTNAVVSSIFLAFVPAYLYRTMAGFSDHEAIGMVGFFSAMLIYVMGITYLERGKSLKRISFFALLSAFFSVISIVTWGGVAIFLFMIFPLSFLIMWLTKTRNNSNFVKKGLIFYLIWVLFTPLFGPFFGFSVGEIFIRFMLGTTGILSLFTAGFIVVDSLFMKVGKNIPKFKDNYRAAYSFGAVVLIGILGLGIIGRNVFSLIKGAWTSIFHPWGTGRVNLTVAENAQPFLIDWISQSGTLIFWMFFGGMLYLGYEISRRVKPAKLKILILFFWTLMISSVLFSRISSASIMNGTNFISQAAYIVGMLASLCFFAWLYFKEKIKIRAELAFIISWMFFTLLSGRAAQRLFFAITPLVCFMAGFFIVKTWHYIKNSRDEIVRPILILLLIISVMGAGFSVYGFEKSISEQAKFTGPSAHYQWQAAMSWVRDNTPENSRFIHWWDYGYWVETLGERPATTDGGHAIGHWDHLIGRYLLTTPYPETAYSLMKTHEVSYLLIDPTDFGKYSAYSSIGSDESGQDRFSSIPLMQLDETQTVEVANGVMRVYTGPMFLDEDIEYVLNGTTVFLPAQKAAVVGVLWRVEPVQDGFTLGQPRGIYYYNNVQYEIPLRYVYSNGRLIDFEEGIDATIRSVPNVGVSSVDPLGTIIYLSPKVSKSLYAQLYLLDDVFENYNDLELVHSEQDQVVSNLRNQGYDAAEILFYQGLRGPIKIWNVNYPEGTLIREEFLATSGGWAELDNLKFKE